MNHDALLAAYRTKKTGAECLELAAMFREAVREAGGQNALARETGITPGTIHHYVSLLGMHPDLKNALRDERLAFREARSLARLPYFRQVELAQPFISGRLSSVDVERLAVLARQHPDASVETLITAVSKPQGRTQEPETPRSAPLPAAGPQTASGAVAMVLEVAGVLDGLNGISQVERLQLRSAVRVLHGRMQRWMEVT
jgi:hypothetical protein